MPATDALVRSLLDALDNCADLERALRETAEQLHGWQVVARAACEALDRELAEARRLRQEVITGGAHGS